MVSKLEKGACQCRKCNRVFDECQVIKANTYLYGNEIKESRCPYCGSKHFGLMKYRNRTTVENVYKKWEMKYAYR
jgi:Zn finger protein HypA/HybF involved in hydrogenase expression